MERVDCIVIGGGVIGLAVARRMASAGLETVVLEREAMPGSHTSSRNSEVIHAGLYYPPGSRKARLCVRGRQQLYRYCEERGVAHRRCGKLIVATSEDEHATLRGYVATAGRNGVTDLAWLTPREVAVMEPAVHCTAALWSPSTGILSSHDLLQALLGDLEASGGSLACRAEVVSAQLGSRHLVIVQQNGARSELESRLLVNAAGLDAQRVARTFAGLDAATIPLQHLAKGLYFTLQGRAPFGHLIYPVARSDGGLGIHVTVDLGGGVRFGPDVEWISAIDYSVDDSRRAAFAAAIRRYYPDLDAGRLQPGYAGIRARISGPGEPAADFCLQGPDQHGWQGLVNLYGIESPGLTASLAIADDVAEALGVVPAPTRN